MIRFILLGLLKLQSLSTVINAAGVVDDVLSSVSGGGGSGGGIDMGTTLVALHYRDGIVVGADTRTSSYPYVSNREAYKITPIHNINVWDEDDGGDEEEESDDSRDDETRTLGKCHVVVARSGSAADTQYLASTVERVIYQRMLQRCQGMMMMSTMDTTTDGVSSSSSSVNVSQIAHLLRYIVREMQQQNGYDFAASLIVAGWERSNNSCSSNKNSKNNNDKGQGRIYSLSRGGTLLDESTSTTRFAVSGSGSTVLLGQLDSLVSSSSSSSSSPSPSDQNRGKNRLETMDQHDAIKLCCSLLRQSMARDNASGGMIRLVVLDDTGRHSYTVYPNQQRLELAAAATRGVGESGHGGPRRHHIDLLD